MSFGEMAQQCQSCDPMYELVDTTCVRVECKPFEQQDGYTAYGDVHCVPIFDVKNCTNIKINYNMRPLDESQPSCRECRNTTYCESLEELWLKCDNTCN